MNYVATSFLSAFLLFQVQLVLGKFLLPWFGGAPAVWSTCLVFFQAMLLLGYGYAHGLMSRCRTPQRQALVHLSLLALSAAALLATWIFWGAPLLPSAAWKPDPAANPVGRILLLLTVGAGLPYFVLAATSPLLQHWYSREQGREPYRLYAVSNAGSLLGLISYPFLIEPAAGLPVQAWIWTGLFLLFAAGMVLCARIPLRGGADRQPAIDSPPPAVPPPLPPDRATIALWILLPAATSALLLAVTNQLCQEVAVVPFLWVLPLALYLLSFILSFAGANGYYRRSWMVPAGALATWIVLVIAYRGVRTPIPSQLIVYSLFLFLFCLIGHGELYRIKPAPNRLTQYYLMISLGGALGGLFIGLTAPYLFRDIWEFHLVLFAGWILLALVFFRDKTSFFHRGDRRHLWVVIFVLSYSGLRRLLFFSPLHRIPVLAHHPLPIALAGAAVLTLLAAWILRRRAIAGWRIWPRTMVLILLVTAQYFTMYRIHGSGRQAMAAGRNFFGVVRVLVQPPAGQKPLAWVLYHGQILHGLQFQDPVFRNQSNSYYNPSSGVAIAMQSHPRRTADPARPDALRVGVLGLGVGTVAAFGQAGDVVRFYEINPLVASLSQGPKPLFTYLKDSPARVEIVPGDARLVLEKEWNEGRNQAYDVLVMDAFSSDSIPAHLLTREAFELYLRHLRDDRSVIAVNITNRFLDLRDPLFGVARELGLSAVFVPATAAGWQYSSSDWVLLSRDPRLAERSAIRAIARPYTPKRHTAWTDRFSNLFDVLR